MYWKQLVSESLREHAENRGLTASVPALQAEERGWYLLPQIMPELFFDFPEGFIRGRR